MRYGAAASPGAYDDDRRVVEIDQALSPVSPHLSRMHVTSVPMRGQQRQGIETADGSPA
jgi:hypothetical protein